MRLAVAGGGYVGLATAVGFARRGHMVDLIETDALRAGLIGTGILPFHEPGLEAALPSVLGRTLAVHPACPAVLDVDIAFVCTGTPSGDDGRLNESEVEAAIEGFAGATSPSVPIVVRSTVNPGSTAGWQRRLARRSPSRPLAFNPEFLREGHALEDFDEPSRRVIGASDAGTARTLSTLYDFSDSPLLIMDPTSAELCKLASNAALALRVSMANEVALMALAVGADPDLVLRAVGADPRIGADYLQPGLGFGGYCLPKDLASFCGATDRSGAPSVFEAAGALNTHLIERMADRVLDLLGKTPDPLVALSGVAFKAGSDSVRGSRGIELARRLHRQGIRVGTTDAGIRWEQQHEFTDWARLWPSPAAAADECDVLVLLHPLEAPGRLSGRRAEVIDALGRTVRATVGAK